ncbi:MAG: hypothetical protein WC294_11180 [Methanoregula sp.]
MSWEFSVTDPPLGRPVRSGSVYGRRGSRSLKCQNPTIKDRMVEHKGARTLKPFKGIKPPEF